VQGEALPTALLDDTDVAIARCDPVARQELAEAGRRSAWILPVWLSEVRVERQRVDQRDALDRAEIFAPLVLRKAVGRPAHADLGQRPDVETGLQVRAEEEARRDQLERRSLEPLAECRLEQPRVLRDDHAGRPPGFSLDEELWHGALLQVVQEEPEDRDGLVRDEVRLVPATWREHLGLLLLVVRVRWGRFVKGQVLGAVRPSEFQQLRTDHLDSHRIVSSTAGPHHPFVLHHPIAAKRRRTLVVVPVAVSHGLSVHPLLALVMTIHSRSLFSAGCSGSQQRRPISASVWWGERGDLSCSNHDRMLPGRAKWTFLPGWRQHASTMSDRKRHRWVPRGHDGRTALVTVCGVCRRQLDSEDEAAAHMESLHIRAARDIVEFLSSGRRSIRPVGALHQHLGLDAARVLLAALTDPATRDYLWLTIDPRDRRVVPPVYASAVEAPRAEATLALVRTLWCAPDDVVGVPDALRYLLPVARVPEALDHARALPDQQTEPNAFFVPLPDVVFGQPQQLPSSALQRHPRSRMLPGEMKTYLNSFAWCPRDPVDRLVEVVCPVCQAKWRRNSSREDRKDLITKLKKHIREQHRDAYYY